MHHYEKITKLLCFVCYSVYLLVLVFLFTVPQTIFFSFYAIPSIYIYFKKKKKQPYRVRLLNKIGLNEKRCIWNS